MFQAKLKRVLWASTGLGIAVRSLLPWSGIYGYSARQRVVNPDGVVNWDAIHAYQARDLYAYISQQRVGWIVDFEFVPDFTDSCGADAASFLMPLLDFKDGPGAFWQVGGI